MIYRPALSLSCHTSTKCCLKKIFAWLITHFLFGNFISNSLGKGQWLLFCVHINMKAIFIVQDFCQYCKTDKCVGINVLNYLLLNFIFVTRIFLSISSFLDYLMQSAIMKRLPFFLCIIIGRGFWKKLQS